MTVAEEMMVEANEVAINYHAQIIRQAFIDFPATCNHCSFPEHFEDWIDKLITYTNMKVVMHRVIKCIDNDYYNPRAPAAYYLTLERQSEEIRKKMRQHEPCERCRRKYNPTDRLGWLPRREPRKGEDFFNV